MKPSHVAAIALVGWLLVSPPIKDGEPMVDAPMRQWKIVDTFPTWTACLAGENTFRENYLPDIENTLNNPFATEHELTIAGKFKRSIEALKCISRDEALKAN
jgi:hypothetical protein